MPDETTEPVDNPSTTDAEQAPEGELDSRATPDETEVPDEPESQSKREARYRIKLREAEAERDTLRQTVEAMQRREVERLAAEHLTKPAALWTAGVELSSLVAEDGTVNPDLVTAAAQDARQQLGLEDPRAKLRRGPLVPREGLSLSSGGNSGTWVDAFK